MLDAAVDAALEELGGGPAVSASGLGRQLPAVRRLVLRRLAERAGGELSARGAPTRSSRWAGAARSRSTWAAGCAWLSSTARCASPARPRTRCPTRSSCRCRAGPASGTGTWRRRSGGAGEVSDSGRLGSLADGARLARRATACARPALGGTKTLQDLFTDRKVPRALRHALPVVVSARTRSSGWPGWRSTSASRVRPTDPDAVGLSATQRRQPGWTGPRSRRCGTRASHICYVAVTDVAAEIDVRLLDGAPAHHRAAWLAGRHAPAARRRGRRVAHDAAPARRLARGPAGRARRAARARVPRGALAGPDRTRQRARAPRARARRRSATSWTATSSCSTRSVTPSATSSSTSSAARRSPSSVFTEPVQRLLADGVADGSLAVDDPEETATVLFNLVGHTYRHLRAGHGWSPEAHARGGARPGAARGGGAVSATDSTAAASACSASPTSASTSARQPRPRCCPSSSSSAATRTPPPGALVFAATVGSSLIQPLFGHAADRLQLPWLMPAGVLAPAPASRSPASRPATRSRSPRSSCRASASPPSTPRAPAMPTTPRATPRPGA